MPRSFCALLFVACICSAWASVPTLVDDCLQIPLETGFFSLNSLRFEHLLGVDKHTGRSLQVPLCPIALQKGSGRTSEMKATHINGGLNIQYAENDKPGRPAFTVSIDIICDAEFSTEVEVFSIPSQDVPVAYYRIHHNEGCTVDPNERIVTGSKRLDGNTPCTEFSIGWWQPEQYDLRQLELYGPFRALDYLKTYNFTWDICRPLPFSCPCLGGASNVCEKPGVAAVCQQWMSGSMPRSCCVGKADGFEVESFNQVGGPTGITITFGQGDTCTFCNPTSRATRLHLVCDSSVVGAPQITNVVPFNPPDPNFEIWMSHISGCEIDKLPPFESGEPIMAQACDDIVVGNQRWDLTPLMNLSPMKAADVSLTNLFTFSICKPLMNACPNTIEPDDMSCNVTGVAAMCHTWRDILGNQASTCGGRSQIVTYSDFNYMGATGIVVRYGGGDDCTVCNPEDYEVHITIICDQTVVGYPSIAPASPAVPPSPISYIKMRHVAGCAFPL